MAVLSTGCLLLVGSAARLTLCGGAAQACSAVQTNHLTQPGWVKNPSFWGGGLPKTVSLIRGCYTGFLCILLVDSLRKCSRGMEGGSPSFIGKVAVGKMCFLSVRV